MGEMGMLSNQVPLAQQAETYWSESRRPLASLVFLAPLLIAYEVGVLLLGVQNGADAFMRWLLGSMGLGQYFLLPVLMVCILLGWHYISRQPWRLSGGILSGMAVECVLLGICLRVAVFLQHVMFQVLHEPAAASIGGTLQHLVGYLGAGIYEELLFRLILMSLAAWAMRRAGAGPRASAIVAILLNSVLFSLAHYVGGGEAFRWFDFLFRFLAGIFFSLLFLYRGFGIAAGSHAAYDILAEMC
jgi:membrane protease YdiL (CAAX protease family)